jgi:Ca-activated chloride channel family protein
MLLLGSLAFSQEGFRLVSEVRLVVLDVGVRDRQGRPVTGLPREAFRVFDSGRERPIAVFAREDSPVTIGLVVDASGSMRHKRSDAESAAGAFLDESNAADEVFVVLFNDVVVAGSPDSPAVLRLVIANAVMEGRTALFDALGAALDQLDRGSRERKALIVISDGGDNASLLRRSAILARVRNAHATIYSVGISDPSRSDGDRGFLREIAQETGGSAHIDVPAPELAGVCRQIAREIRSRYTVAFHAHEAARTEKRPVRVQVEAPNLGPVRVLCRRSYIATPPRGDKP